jgi:hypothetical protein
MHMKKLLILVPVICSLAFSTGAVAAGKSMDDQVDPGITDGTAAREFRQARDKWLEQGIKNYRMKAVRTCFCAGPFQARITVRKGKPVKISNRPWYGPRTVPGMFRIISQAIKRKVAVLDVKYDARLGYPKKAWIDYIAMAADDEIGYRIKSVKELRP